MGLDATSRVVIVGTSGAGKSTLARTLCARLKIKDIELDALFWGPNWSPASATVFRERIEQAIQGSQGWVIHGNYSKVRDLTWGQATHLIWLDYSRPVVFWRVFKRSIFRILNREPLWAGNRESFRKTFLSRESILLWSIQTYSLRKQQYEELTRSPDFSELQVLRFQSPAALRQFLRSLFAV